MVPINITPLSPVTRTKAQAKEAYDRMSLLYDYFAGIFEQPYKDMALNHLNITRGETVLEIGFGTGQCLRQIAELVGESGRVNGIDISSGMLSVTKKRLERAGLWSRVELTCEDAVILPYPDNQFDAVFMSFVLELFDTPEIPQMLVETRRVLKPGGRVGVISIARDRGESLSLKFYEWLHQKLPQFFDCRPIYVEQSIYEAGFTVKYEESLRIMSLPGEIVVGIKEKNDG